MTRSNLHIKFSNGKSLICVADSSSAPEQGYIVEQLIQPLLLLDNSEQELQFLSEHCTMDERRLNADYRYTIDLKKKEVRFFEEHYSYKKERFIRGRDITHRYDEYIKNLEKIK
ncbi:penicillin-binding protein [Chryseobacterium terrae]|uniref:Penicillin-binding protein n=1 Tax=Chryseobacterium terrae TaxID=3163299 RepID=A0ABW8Y6G5_9FLAO